MLGPLAGIKVLEFSEYIAGPFAGMQLGDMGAHIIKIEPPGGEPWRHVSSFIPDESRNFISLNRGKHSLPLDLSRPEAREIVYRLLNDIDVVIVNARPDVSAKLGIDYETLSARKPDLVYCDNTAFGRTGPDRHRPGYDLIAQAVTGLMASEAKVKDRLPQRIQSTALADFATGLAMAWGICAALYHRERTGRGQMVQTTLLATALGFQTSTVTQVEAVDKEPRQGFLDTLGRLRESGAPFDQMLEEYRHQRSPWRMDDTFYRTYQASDGVIAVACLSERLRLRFLDVLGLEDRRFEPDFDPDTEDVEAISADLSERARNIFRNKTVADWLETFDRAGVPAGPIKFPDELLTDEQVLANDLVVELEHTLAGPVKMAGPMLKMSDSPLSATKASPALGEDTREILERLGYSDDDIQRLIDEGVTQ